jgi:hypothetical protein
MPFLPPTVPFTAAQVLPASKPFDGSPTADRVP